MMVREVIQKILLYELYNISYIEFNSQNEKDFKATNCRGGGTSPIGIYNMMSCIFNFVLTINCNDFLFC